MDLRTKDYFIGTSKAQRVEKTYSRWLQRVIQEWLFERKHRIRSCSRPSKHSFIQISESAQIVLKVASVEVSTRALRFVATITAIVAQITHGHVRNAMIAAAFKLISRIALLCGLLVFTVSESQVVDRDHAVIWTSHAFDDHLKLFGASWKLNSHLFPFFGEIVADRFDQTIAQTWLYIDVYLSSLIAVYLIPEFERAWLACLVVNRAY